MNISDTFCMSSVEAPKLQRAPETSVPSTEKTLLLKEQPNKWFACFKQGNFDMSDTQRSGRPCCASENKLRGFGPLANYADRATAAC
jgi:hypothetical protein